MSATQYKRALVIKLQHHGDVLLASPVFNTLAAVGIEADALVFDDTSPMIAGHPGLAQLHTIARKGRRSLGLLGWLLAEWQLFFALRARRYDLIVHLTTRRRGAWLARLLGAKTSVAPDTLKDRFWRKSFSHLFPELRGTRHMVEIQLDALRRVGIQPTDANKSMHMPLDAPSIDTARQLLALHGVAIGSYVLVHPTSRWMFKAWPAANMAKVIDALSTAGETVILTAAKAPEEIAMVDAIKAQLQTPVLDLTGQVTLKQLGALIADAKLWFGLDSAPMHIAAAVGTPCVALFGPSVTNEWSPWQVPHRIVAHQGYSCRPCAKAGCGDGGVSDCLVNLPVAAVLQAISELSLQVSRPIRFKSLIQHENINRADITCI